MKLQNCGQQIQQWDEIITILDSLLWESSNQATAIINQSPRGSEGVDQSLDSLKARVSGLKSTCQLKQSQFDRSHEAINSFTVKLDLLDRWIDNHGFDFLRYNTNLGPDYETAVKFRESNLNLTNQVIQQMIIYSSILHKSSNYLRELSATAVII